MGGGLGFALTPISGNDIWISGNLKAAFGKCIFRVRNHCTVPLQTRLSAGSMQY